MGSLPSFIDLMDSLGLEQANQTSTGTADQPPSPQLSSPCLPAVGWKNAPTRSSSSPSLRDVATLHHISRYSPYPSALVRHGGISFNIWTWSFSQSPTRRRRSLSPVSSSSDFESSPLSPVSAGIFSIWITLNNVAQTFSNSSRRRPRKTRNKRLHVGTYGSSSDLTADTPISTYVRRKTPGTSPTSPSFTPDSGYESSSSLTAMPFSIPSLPVLLANSPSSDTVSNTPSSDSELEDLVQTTFKSEVKRISKSDNGNCSIVRRPTGVRISVPPYPTNLRERFMDLWSHPISLTTFRGPRIPYLKWQLFLCCFTYFIFILLKSLYNNAQSEFHYNIKTWSLTLFNYTPSRIMYVCAAEVDNLIMVIAKLFQIIITPGPRRAKRHYQSWSSSSGPGHWLPISSSLSYLTPHQKQYACLSRR